MAHLRLSLILLAVCTLLSSCDARSKAKNQFMQDLDAIIADVHVMYDEIRPQILSAPQYDPDIYIAFADINFDEIPEFFYGYQTISGSHNKIWFRAYSLKDRAIISGEHNSDWDTSLDDEECAFFTSPKNFIEGYYLTGEGVPCFVTKAITGPVTGMWTDYAFFEYTGAELLVSTGFECHEELTAIKQVWSPSALETLKEDIIRLLDEYCG